MLFVHIPVAGDGIIFKYHNMSSGDHLRPSFLLALAPPYRARVLGLWAGSAGVVACENRDCRWKAIRQLAYLYGLPALDPDAAQRTHHVEGSGFTLREPFPHLRVFVVQGFFMRQPVQAYRYNMGSEALSP